MTLAALFSKPAALPVVPKVVQQLIQSFQRDDISIAQIAEQLAADPVLSAKTLRLANSAYFHVSRHIGTVDDALRMLGFVMVRNLVVGCGVSGAFKGVQGIDLPRFWRHSAHTAAVARWLAPHAQLNSDQAFTIGLLQGVGQLVMHAADAAHVRPLDDACDPLSRERAALERERLGYHHGEVGGELARRWNFPPAISDPLSQAPMPPDKGRLEPQAALAHIAAWRSRIDVLRLTDEQAQAECPLAPAKALGLELAWCEGRLDIEGHDGPATMPPLADLGSGMESMFG